MAERPAVNGKVGGSNPLSHPKYTNKQLFFYMTDTKNQVSESPAAAHNSPVEPAKLTKPISSLIYRYVAALTAPKPATTPLHVDEIASRVAKLYELVRKVIDWKEDNALRRSAIERILKRLLFSRLSGLSPEHHINIAQAAETLTLDLIRGGHLPNDTVPQEKIPLVAAILTKYVSFLEHATIGGSDPLLVKRRINFHTFLIELAACEIEELLTDPVLEKELLLIMTEAMAERIQIQPTEALNRDEKFTLIYTAVCRTLFDLDDVFITFHLLSFQYPQWKNPSLAFQEQMNRDIVAIWEQSSAILHHPLAKQFYVFCERVDTVFALIGDVLAEHKDEPQKIQELVSNKIDFLKEIELNYDKRYGTLKKRLFRLAIFSTLSVFASNWFTFYLIEVPLANTFAEGFNLFTAFIDFLIPTAVMFLLVAIIRPPPPANKKNVLDAVQNFVYHDGAMKYFEIRAKSPRRPIMRAIIGAFFAAVTVLLFSAVAWVFWVAGLPITSVIFDTATIALTVFAAVIIRNKSKELTVGEKITVLEFILDMVSVPVAKIGSLLASKWKEYNIVAFIFTFLIETPFTRVIDLIEQWSQFLKDRRAELH